MRGVVDSPTHRYGESIFDYEYLHEFEAKIETARKLHYKKRFAIFPSPAGMSLTKLSLDGNNLIIPAQRGFGLVWWLTFFYSVVCGTYADLNYAKTSENSVHCCVPLINFFAG